MSDDSSSEREKPKRDKNKNPTFREGKLPEWAPAFIRILRETANVAAACRGCREGGIRRKYAYDLKAVNTEFAAQWNEALEEALDALETVARDRALEGSERMLMFLLRAHRPAVYNQVGPISEDIGNALGAILSKFENS